MRRRQTENEREPARASKRLTEALACAGTI
jgi:hypothetical protein